MTIVHVVAYEHNQIELWFVPIRNFGPNRIRTLENVQMNLPRSRRRIAGSLFSHPSPTTPAFTTHNPPSNTMTHNCNNNSNNNNNSSHQGLHRPMAPLRHAARRSRMVDRQSSSTGTPFSPSPRPESLRRAQLADILQEALDIASELESHALLKRYQHQEPASRSSQ